MWLFTIVMVLVFMIGFVQSTDVYRCPAFFYVTDLKDYVKIASQNHTEADYGNYILMNRTQLPPPYLILQDNLDYLSNYHECYVTVVIISDNIRLLKADIDRWIWYECQRLHKRQTDCYRPAGFGVFKATPPKQPGTYVIYHADEVSNQTSANTASRTSAPSIPEKCSKRDHRSICELGENKCHWFGTYCHDINWCGLVQREACLARKQYCQWSITKGCFPKRGRIG